LEDSLSQDGAAGSLPDMPADAWRRVFDANVTGTFMMTRAAARLCAQLEAVGGSNAGRFTLAHRAAGKRAGTRG
jgi:NAD(P)-dependent dehydrogenase (short-subunit alcohol dehydrogenase family)